MTITLTREEAQQVLDALQCATPPTFSAKIVEDWEKAVEFLRARLAQPEPEPVAGYRWEEGRIPPSVTYTAPPQRNEPEPVMLMDAPLLLNGQPLYTAPPQREWQGLTDEEISELIRNTHNAGSFVRAIEAKLREKNA